MSATIKDVAEASGVSSATVSYVINNGPRAVRPSTRERVERAIQELNYHPNAMARSLVRRYTNTMGVLFANESVAGMSHYASSMLSGIMMGATTAGYSLTLFTQSCRSVAGSEIPFRDGRTDGVIVIAPPETSDLLTGLCNLGLPLVAVGCSPFGDHDISFVDVDNAAGIRMAMDHLLSLGHRRIASLIGPPNLTCVRIRHITYMECMRAAGLNPMPDYTVASSYDPNYNYKCIRTLLSLPERPTAIVAGNDDLALKVLEVAREFNISVPEQLSVIGFDDIPSAQHTSPTLTTIRQPLDQIGARGTQLLVDRLDDHLLPSSATLIQPTLIVRKSTAPALK